MSGISLLLESRERGPGGPMCQLHNAGNSFPLRLVPTPGAPTSYQGLAILVVERDDEVSVSAIDSNLGPQAFPGKMVLDVGLDGVIQIPQPTFLDAARQHESWSVLRFRGLDGRVSKYEEGLGIVDEKEIERDSKSETAVGTWISERAVLGPDLVASSLVLLMCRSTERHNRHHVRDFAARLQDYFNRDPEKLSQIRANPLFIYTALYDCFNSFETILHQFERVYRDVADNHEKSLYGIFGRCYQLNKGLISMSYCYPDVMMHKAVIKRLDQLNRKGRDGQLPRGPRLDLDMRLKDMEMDLKDFEDHLGFISDRFKTALELEFNLSGERQNLIMMWFTGFTVLFTPIAFVAAVFALTDSNIAWFLLAGSMVLIISIVICIWAYSSVVNLGHRVKSSAFRGLLHKLPYQEPHKRSGPSDDSDGHRPYPGRSPTRPGPSGPPTASGMYTSSYPRRDSYMPPAPGGGRPYSGAYAASSSSSGQDGGYYRRTGSKRKSTAPAIRTGSESGTMMYSRRPTPQSSSMQRPEMYQIPTASRTRTKPSGSGPPISGRARRRFDFSSLYPARPTRGPVPPPPRPPQQAHSGPSGNTYVVINTTQPQPPAPPPPPPQHPHPEEPGHTEYALEGKRK